MKILSSNAGVTLVEALVTIAIISGIAFVAVPRYENYRAISRQQEAKLWLSNLHVAEQAFAIENCSYTACLPRIGVFPGDDPNYGGDIAPHYLRGFQNAEATGSDCGPPAGSSCSTPANDNQACSNQAFVPNVAAAVGCTTSAGAGLAMGAVATGVEAHGTFGNAYTASRRINQGFAFPTNGNMAASNISATAFTGVAVGNISSVAIYDIWTINRDKKLLNNQVGTGL